MNKRQCAVEFWRFVAAILIMTHHLFSIGIEKMYPFRYASIYVEFFFIISGYFTMKHYEKYKKDLLDDRVKDVFGYTLKKYITFLPYVIIMVIAVYYIKYFQLLRTDIRGFISQVPNALTEIFMLSAVTEIREAGNLWFLSAMLLVFPIFSLICQIKSKYLIYLISFYLPVFYYGIFRVESITHFPYNLLRAISAMMLGIWVYFLSNYISNIELKRNQKIVLTIIEQGLLILAFISCFYNLQIGYLYLLAFVLSASLMFSKHSYTNLIDNNFILFLGKLSFPIYICHGIVQKLMNFKLNLLDSKNKIIVYYFLSIVISIVVYLVVENIKTYAVRKGREK